MAIYVTGDTHQSIDISKLNARNFPQQKGLTKEDYLIICGDFGMVWSESRQEHYWRKWLAERNYTTLFVDGNHENFDLLENYPKVEMFGGTVRKINDSIYQLLRGEIYTIQGKKFFTFGGADSVDKVGRTEFKSWWRQEMPTTAEYEHGLAKLEEHNWEVDYVITHTTPKKFMLKLFLGNPKIILNPILEKYLDIIYKTADFTHWYHGHWHQDKYLADDITVIYNKIYKIV